MGGILSAPPAPPMQAPQPQPLPQPQPIVQDDGTKERVDRIERQRRGRAGTVLTSDRGLLSANTGETQKKTLLGE